MTQMEEKRETWLLDEPIPPLSGWVTMLMLGMAAVLCAGCAWAFQEAVLRVLFIIWACILAGLALLTRWIVRRYRLVMNTQGVRMENGDAMKWDQVRTAAIIQRGKPAMNLRRRHSGDYHFILLSVQESEKAIDKWTFLMERAKPGRDMRIPYTDRRREVVEHYLGRNIPTIRM